tara:strand:+ start:534 stop:686 length:153 start_codon:yes stop_codon:yes gene_type:complete
MLTHNYTWYLTIYEITKPNNAIPSDFKFLKDVIKGIIILRLVILRYLSQR